MTATQVLDRAATICTILASAAVVWAVGRDVISGPAIRTPQRKPLRVPHALQDLHDAKIKGSSTAKVAIIEYSDFQCPYCARFTADTLPALNDKYIRTNKIILAFRYFPLAIHPLAMIAAEGAECAAAQGNFWPMHDALFKAQKDLSEKSIVENANGLGLRMTDFQGCLAAKDDKRIEADRVVGKGLGITGTPFFLVGVVQPGGGVAVTQVIDGARPLADFEGALDKVLAGVK
jgi:protein-disulfide isomerase